MKDKLEKTRHTKLHYYFKRVGICFSFFVGATVVVAIPLSIATIIKTNEEKKKEEEKNKELEKEKTKEELLTF